MRPLLAFLAIHSAASASAQCTDKPFEVAYSWDGVEINWPNASVGEEWADVWSPMPVGLKVFEEDVIVTFPRWRMDAYPVNVARMPRPGVECIDEPASPSAT